MKMVADAYMRSILADLDYQAILSDYLIVLYFVFISAFCLFIGLFYIPRLKMEWRNIQNILMILNDEIVTTGQLKYIFKKSSYNI